MLRALRTPLLCFLLGAALFWGVFPRLDITIQGWFFDQTAGVFPGKQNVLLEFLSEKGVPLLAAGLLFLALFWLGKAQRTAVQAQRQDYRRAGFLVLFTLLLGCGLVVNEVFKNHWGRARPSQIAEFGGPRPYTPPLVRHRGADACPRNCSFVSGDASVGFALYALAFALPRQRRRWLMVGTLAGASLGLVRMAQGAHFASDVWFCGVFMYLTALALARLYTSCR